MPIHYCSTQHTAARTEDIRDMAVNMATMFCFMIHLLVFTALFLRLILKVNLQLTALRFSTSMNIQHMSCPSTRQKVPEDQILYPRLLSIPLSTEPSPSGGAK